MNAFLLGMAFGAALFAAMCVFAFIFQGVLSL